MRKILFLILMLSSVGIQAQNLIVKGVVSDESDVLPGVSIFVEVHLKEQFQILMENTLLK